MITTRMAPVRGHWIHLIPWLVTGIVVGWFIVYNALRLGGDGPNQAVVPAVIIGGIAGIIIATLGFVWARRREVAGRPVVRGRIRTADASQLSTRDRELVRLLWPMLLGVAVISAAVGAAVALHWLGLGGAIPKSELLVTVWDAVLAVWLLDEALRARQLVFDGIEALYFGCLLTAVLASIGIARNFVAGGQVVLIVAAGIAAAGIGVMTWRLSGGRLIPVSAIIAVVVAGLSLVIPLAS
jgi:hypothetical protein